MFKKNNQQKQNLAVQKTVLNQSCSLHAPLITDLLDVIQSSIYMNKKLG